MASSAQPPVLRDLGGGTGPAESKLYKKKKTNKTCQIQSRDIKEAHEMNDYGCCLPPINPTPCMYLRVMWICTLLNPGSRGRQ